MTRPRSFDWDRAARMLDDGSTIDGVVRELGCTRNALYNARRAMGLTHRFKVGSRPCDDERVDRLTRQGWSQRAIAESMGVSVRTVERSRARLKAQR